jgi:glutathione S-transferase
MRPRLYTIPISHYGERARWALDRAGVEYEEIHHLQMFAWGPALWYGGKKTLPILVTRAEVLTDSLDIVRWADARAACSLYPPSLRREIDVLERDLAGDFGVETRRIVYDGILRNIDAVALYNAGRAPEAERIALHAFKGLALAFARRYLGVHTAELAQARGHVDRVFDRIGERLADGRAYLFGGDFTAADLTFAAMAAPAVLPAQYPVPLPPLSVLPDDAAARVGRLREHPAGRFALRLYAERPKPKGLYRRALRVTP